MRRAQLLLLFAILSVAFAAAPLSAAELYVSPNGSDANPGTREQPLQSFAAARQAARKARAGAANQSLTVWFQGGMYYLPETVVLTSEDSGTPQAPVIFAAVPGEQPVLSGGMRLKLAWVPYKGGIMQAKVPAGLITDQLFVNGERQSMARYPNFDATAQYFNGFAADAFAPARAARWADPRGGYIHAMHRSLWGDMHWVITGKNAKGEVTYEGGWQNNRPAPMHDNYRFVENIFEELDAPGEWFLDTKTSTLYFYPPAGLDLKTATIEGVRLRHLLELRGSEASPVHDLTLRGLTFRHAARTFMDNREPLLRSDWTTYRGGALFLTGTVACAIEGCTLDQPGGNAIFVNMYNRRLSVRRCHIVRAGANGIAFVGDPKATRNGITFTDPKNSYDAIDKTPGPQSDNYPADCLVEDCLIHETGRVEKQTAPIQIAMSQGITVRHCSIYDVPRAGINIGDGCWGGHVIEFCDVFDTVKETGDHGSFNSWGRDRFWSLQGVGASDLSGHLELPRLDAVRPTILRNNRWRCDHGWDIDLDDGSSNYQIYNNLCLNGGLKNREGYFRVVENNVMVNNSFHPHVWYVNSQDIFRGNIVFSAYKPIRVPRPWGREVDHNLLHVKGQSAATTATALQALSGRDEHSLAADALFADPARGDYRVKDGSPALRLGFKNFPMDQFGVQDPGLKALARTPELPGPNEASKDGRSRRDGRIVAWQGGRVKNVAGMGEVSAGGLPGETGVLIVDAPAASPLARAGLRPGDVILKANGKPVDRLRDLQNQARATSGRKLKLGVWRNQQDLTLELELP